MSWRSYCSYVNLSTVRENKISKIFFKEFKQMREDFSSNQLLNLSDCTVKCLPTKLTNHSTFTNDTNCIS